MKIGQYLAKIWTSGSGLLFFGPPCTHARSTFDIHVNLTFDPLTSGSVHAEQPPCIVCLPTLVLIARVVSILEHGHTTHRHTQTHQVTDSTYLPSHYPHIGSRHMYVTEVFHF